MDFKHPKTLQTSFSLKAQCKANIQSNFLNLKEHAKSFLLIIDEKSLKIISSLFKMVELMEMGITAVEKLELKRKPFPKMHAIYFLNSDPKNIEFLVEDFKNVDNPQYGLLHLFFINRVSQENMKLISSCKPMLKKVKTFKEIYSDFLIVEDFLFTLDMPQALSDLFSRPENFSLMIEEIAIRLSHVVLSFEKVYEIEIVYVEKENKLAEMLCKKLFNAVNLQLDQMVKSKPAFLDPSAGKIVVLLFDRSFDPVAPLMHDFFYQPMVYDLLDIKNNYYEFQEEKEGKSITRKFFLNDNDDLFDRYKYRHIAEALDGIPGEFQNFLKQNTTAKVQQGVVSNLDLHKMSEIIKSMPQYNEILSKYTLHMNLIENTWNVFESKQLKDLGELEQTLTTGLNKEGSLVKPPKQIQSLSDFIFSMSSLLHEIDILRIILIAYFSIEIPEKDLKKLLNYLTTEHQSIIPKLHHLGLHSKLLEQKGKNKKSKDEMKKNAKSKLSTATLDLCRYFPQLDNLADELLDIMTKEKEISESKNFPLCSVKINEKSNLNQGAGPKSLKIKKVGMKISGDNDTTVLNCQKLIIFGLGGIGYNEIRCVMEHVGEDVVVVCGATQIMKPSEYVDGIKHLY